jgi:hypothetical protein
MEVEEKNHLRSMFNVITSNISAGGVFFKAACGNCFMPGAEANFTIFLSAQSGVGKPFTSKISGNGRVVRRENLSKDNPRNDEKDPEWAGIALEFDEPLKMH